MPKNGKKGFKTSRMAGSGPSAKKAWSLAHGSMNMGVPPSHLATLAYPVYFTSSSMSGNIWTWQFRGNSLFDPDFTGSGNQPTTFDQWMTLYNAYRVLSVSVDFTIVDLTNAFVGGAMSPSDNASPTLSFSGIAGNRDSVLVRPLTSVAAYSVWGVKKTWLIKDIFGIDEEALMSELNFAGSSSGSAAHVAYLNLAMIGAGATDSVAISGIMKFGVRFEGPIANNVSLSRALPRAVDAADSQTASGATVTSVADPSAKLPPAVIWKSPPVTLTPVEARLLEAYRAAPPRQ